MGLVDTSEDRHRQDRYMASLEEKKEIHIRSGCQEKVVG